MREKDKEYIIYDMEAEKVYQNLTAGEAGDIMGIEGYHVNRAAKEATLVNGNFVAYFQEKYDVRSTLNITSFCDTAKVPKSYYRPVIEDKKREFRLRLENAWRKSVEGTLGYNKYYVLDERGLPVKIFDTDAELAEHLRIPVGTAKSRMFRIGALKHKRGKVNMCRMSEYEEVRKHYF